jgi:hypothetical protein
MKLRFNHQHQPMGDHSFDDAGQLLTSKTLKGLVGEVRDYRLRNGFPVGDPEQEIAEAYSVRYPWLVETPKAAQIGPPEPQDSPGEVVARFVRSVWTNPPKAVFTIEKAEARIKACRECPFNKPFDVRREGGDELVRRIYLLSRGESPAGLGYCPCHQWFAGLAVMLPEAAKLAKSEMPEECWIKTEQATIRLPLPGSV